MKIKDKLLRKLTNALQKKGHVKKGMITEMHSAINYSNAYISSEIGQEIKTSVNIFGSLRGFNEDDRFCIIVDRDRDSFTVEQYDEVLQNCENEGIDIYVCNPCFELWLLLHFTSNRDCITRAATKKCVDVEKELRTHVNGYQKEALKYADFKDNIQDAIIHSMAFCTQLTELKNPTTPTGDHIGTNLGTLFNQLYGESKDIVIDNNPHSPK